MNGDVWDQAFALMSDRGQSGASQLVAAGMQKTPSSDVAQIWGWQALADCLNALTDATGTRR